MTKKGVRMRRVCAWCKKVMGYIDDATMAGEDTHGVCRECSNKQYGRLSKSGRHQCRV